MKKNLPPLTLTAASVINEETLFISGKSDHVAPETPQTQLFHFDSKNKTLNNIHELPHDIVSLCTTTDTYWALSKNGTVESSNNKGRTSLEQIKGAGLEQNQIPVYGYVEEIRPLGSKLFVCGGGGQIYQRQVSEWTPFTSEFLTPAIPPKPGSTAIPKINHQFTSLDGFSESNFYVAGYEGEIQHFNGKNWQQCITGTENILMRIRVSADGSIWACGFNSTLLLSTNENTFTKIPSSLEGIIFHDLCIYKNKPYLATNSGLFYFDGKKIDAVPLFFPNGESSVLALGCYGNILWCIGYRSLAAFDGKTWWVNY